jgi:hypothetical protein
MTKYYSSTTGGFYDTALHGTKTVFVADPTWQRPILEYPDPTWNAENYPPGTPHPTIAVPDVNAAPPIIEVDNPDCLLRPMRLR